MKMLIVEDGANARMMTRLGLAIVGFSPRIDFGTSANEATRFQITCLAMER